MGQRTNTLLSRHGIPSVDYKALGVFTLGIKLNEEQYNGHKDMRIIF